MPEQQTPQETLAAIRRSREQMGRRMSYSPWWYDLGYGGAVAVMTAGQGAPLPFGPISLALGLGVIALIVHKWTAKTGVWINGYQPRRARWVAFGLVAALVSLMIAAVVLGYRDGPAWAVVGIGVLAGILAVVGSRLWTRVYLAETRELP